MQWRLYYSGPLRVEERASVVESGGGIKTGIRTSNLQAKSMTFTVFRTCALAKPIKTLTK